MVQWWMAVVLVGVALGPAVAQAAPQGRVARRRAASPEPANTARLRLVPSGAYPIGRPDSSTSWPPAARSNASPAA